MVVLYKRGVRICSVEPGMVWWEVVPLCTHAAASPFPSGTSHTMGITQNRVYLGHRREGALRMEQTKKERERRGERGREKGSGGGGEGLEGMLTHVGCQVLCNNPFNVNIQCNDHSVISDLDHLSDMCSYIEVNYDLINQVVIK